MRANDRSKDQTYYLSSIPESGLDKALFPLADIPKTQVREIARAAGLHNASREESMGLCFVGERRRFNDFLSVYLSFSRRLGFIFLILKQTILNFFFFGKGNT